MSDGIDKVRLFLGLVLLAVGLAGFVERDVIIEKMREPSPGSRYFNASDSFWPMSDSERERHRIEERRQDDESQRWQNKQTFNKQAVLVVSGVVFFAGLGIAVFSLGGRKQGMR